MMSSRSRHGLRLFKQARLKPIKRVTSDGSANGVNLTMTARHPVQPPGDITVYSGWTESWRNDAPRAYVRETVSALPIKVYPWPENEAFGSPLGGTSTNTVNPLPNTRPSVTRT